MAAMGLHHNSILLRIVSVCVLAVIGVVLGRSFLFYAAQRSGDLGAANRVAWRRSAHLSDAVVGGYYDAGDYLKISYTIAHTTMLLAWGALDFPGGTAAAGQTAYARSAVRWGADYLAACHVAPFSFVGLIGDMEVDHNTWGRPEEQRVPRPALVWNRTQPASDLLGLTSAALAASSMLYRPVNAAYADALLSRAAALYEWGVAVPGRYSKSMPGYPAGLYESWRYEDKLMLAAAWLARATGKSSYLAAAYRHFQDAASGDVSPYFTYDSHFASATAVLLGIAGRVGAANVPGYQQYRSYMDGLFLDSHLAANGNWGIVRTPLGLVYPSWSKWGNNRYATHAAFIALVRARQLPATDPNRAAAYRFAKAQVDYVLGLAGGRSYVVGWGTNPPLRCHHSGASCPDRPAPCDWAAFDNPGPNPQVLLGALVAGPSGPGDSGYRDVRSDYVTNEVAIDYNAGLTAALQALLTFTVA